MTERMRSASYANQTKMPGDSGHDLGPRKTLLVLVIVVGCFAVLWPKVFYPMLVGNAQQHIKPSPIDRTTGCCNVISESDVDTIKIMSELCNKIITKGNESSSLPSGREIVAQCRKAVLDTCGIDISAVLQEQVRLGQTTKQIIDEIRSLNGSLCLKYNFGVSPSSLGTPHRVTVKMSPISSVRQERPPHLRSEMVHPAFRERGRAIPQTQGSSLSRPPPRIVEGRPGPIPGMRPTMGGAGHVVAPKQSTSTMGLIMPVYTIGIVIFFTYTVLKIVFKKQPESLYPPVEPDPVFRREVFEANRGHKPIRDTSNKLGVAGLEQLHRRLRETEAAMERIVQQMAKVPLELQDIMANGKVHNHEDQASGKVLGMEMTASCEGGKKWTSSSSPFNPAPPPPVQESAELPQEIYLEGALPPQSNHLLVADAATEAEKPLTEEDPAIVLAGKMTLSVISLDSSENGTEESSDSGKKQDNGRSSSNTSDDFEKVYLEHLDQEEAEEDESNSQFKREETQEDFKEEKVVTEEISDINETKEENITEHKETTDIDDDRISPENNISISKPELEEDKKIEISSKSDTREEIVKEDVIVSNIEEKEDNNSALEEYNKQDAELSSEEKSSDEFKKSEVGMDESFRTDASESISETDKYLEEILNEDAANLQEPRREIDVELLKVDDIVSEKPPLSFEAENAKEQIVDDKESDASKSSEPKEDTSKVLNQEKEAEIEKSEEEDDEEVEYEIEYEEEESDEENDEEIQNVDGSQDGVIESRVNGIQSNGDNSEEDNVEEIVEYISDEDDVEEEEEIEENEVNRVNNEMNE